ncbi:hypothetical protein [Pseudonocardia hydrocarbonoxydans]|uniref:NTP pyrophosphohydrolase n=1 Tax=Pseudonocardia hydrocarbonoxydans TaxID=76726 RepID=A0A4Y3WGB4_9PSEU|nr:hypothetical protein [Pseudonocardia hydrocarbonoxydans]GEC17903.1 hypothetical protein PHY01_01860 [Pseudonocardia hydrocarbonoxydans]
MTHVIVDGANVVGSRPDGWWRDRPGAAERLAARLVAALTDGRLVAAFGPEPRLHLVLEGAATAADLPTHPSLAAVLAPADGDATIVALATSLAGRDVVVVTADRGLRERVRAAGARTAGPSVLLDALPGGLGPLG